MHAHTRCFAISFECDDVIILQFDWMFLILGMVQVFGLGVPESETVLSHVCITRNGLGTRLYMYLF